jgi:monoterpene epsilon-lactone hydrolase
MAKSTEPGSAILPPERAGTVVSTDLVERRAGLAAAVAAGYWCTEPAPEELDIGSVRCLRFASPTPSRGSLLHLHGGAFRIGCPEQMGPFAAALAARCEIDVICPAYRLAPEHPFPAGLSDCWATLRELAAHGETPLVVTGDSAGGGLAAGLAALSQQVGIRLDGLALLFPWLDLTVTSQSYTTNAGNDPLFSTEFARAAASFYLQGLSGDHRLASPLHGSVAGFPPTLINVGMGEVLLDDARRLYDHLHRAGIAAELHLVAGMEHVAVTRDRTLPGSAETFEKLATFIRQVLAAARYPPPRTTGRPQP